MERAAALMAQAGIDLWLIVTSEGSDPCLATVTGVHTVGPGAFVITSNGQRHALCSRIDAQDIEESRLFDSVIKYPDSLGPSLAELIASLKPARIALNYSEGNPFCDGLTLGRMRWLRKALADVFNGDYVSSEPFLARLHDCHG
jgi:hypothetical protein